MESTQHLLDHVRPPRVHITYDVEIGDAIEVVELPFVVGVMADLSGNNNSNLPQLSKRKFVEIEGDTFNKIMAAAQPQVVMTVPDKIKNDGSALSVELNFASLDDFEPVSVAKQIPELAALYEMRTRLSELLSKVSSNEALNELLEGVVQNQSDLGALQKLVATTAPSSSSGSSGSSSSSSGSAPSGSDPKPGGKK